MLENSISSMKRKLQDRLIFYGFHFSITIKAITSIILHYAPVAQVENHC